MGSNFLKGKMRGKIRFLDFEPVSPFTSHLNLNISPKELDTSLQGRYIMRFAFISQCAHFQHNLSTTKQNIKRQLRIVIDIKRK